MTESTTLEPEHTAHREAQAAIKKQLVKGADEISHLLKEIAYTAFLNELERRCKKTARVSLTYGDRSELKVYTDIHLGFDSYVSGPDLGLSELILGSYDRYGLTEVKVLLASLKRSVALVEKGLTGLEGC